MLKLISKNSKTHFQGNFYTSQPPKCYKLFLKRPQMHDMWLCLFTTSIIIGETPYLVSRLPRIAPNCIHLRFFLVCGDLRTPSLLHGCEFSLTVPVSFLPSVPALNQLPLPSSSLAASCAGAAPSTGLMMKGVDVVM